MVKATTTKPKGKPTVQRTASARILNSRKAAGPPPVGSEVYVGDLLMEILQAKYDGLNLQMQARFGTTIADEEIIRVQKKHDACLKAFTTAATLSDDADSILSDFDREDLRLWQLREDRTLKAENGTRIARSRTIKRRTQ
eukprot:gene8927-12069_t